MRARILSVLILTAWSGVRAESRCPAETDAYASAVSSGHTDQALRLLLDGLGWSTDDRKRVVIEPGLAAHNGERNAEADPDTLQINVDPALFSEGQSEGCEDLVHEMTHLRHFLRDRQALSTHFGSTLPSAEGWKGCDGPPKPTDSVDAKTAAAYDCLLDNALVPHAAAYEIEAVLAQARVARGRLRFDDEEYLVESMKHFDKKWGKALSQKNEEFYLPTIKSEDRAIFCQGAAYLSHDWNDTRWTAECPPTEQPLIPLSAT